MENPQHLAERLGHVEHFKQLTLKERMSIVTAGQIRRIPAGLTIFVEGEPCAGLFVLLAGRVHLCKLGPQGEELILAVIEPVIMFNEVATLDEGPNPVTALASSNCLVWQVSAGRFHTILQHHPQIGLGLLKVLAARNRFLISQYEDLSFRSVLARTAKLLLDLSQYGQQPVDRHTHPNQQMAARIATVPEAFSRSLNTFKKQGYISTTRHTINILEPDKLAKLALIGPVLPEG
jgi:CRP/FNR family transcriptional regulator